MISKDSKAEITLVHDITEVSNRSLQFVIAALIAGLINIPVNVHAGHRITTLTLLLFCTFLCVIFFMLKKGFTRYTKTIIITGINIFLTLFNFTDGLRMGNYLYFFPLLFALPFLISSQNKYNKQVLSYFIFTVSCFCMCIYFVPAESNWQQIREEQYPISFTINCICAILLSTVFSYLGIQFEKSILKLYSDKRLEKKTP